ncbi:MAG: diphthine--ammonia ligase [Chitinophagaceae bacterium]
MNKAIVAWSGGKDSCYAMMQAKKTGIEAVLLLNVLNEEGNISRAHGIPFEILQAQAKSCNIDLYCVASSWKDYEQKFFNALETLKKQYGASHVIFGDIDLAEHREWNEKICIKAELEAVFPLWKQDRKELVLEMIDDGMKAMMVSCNDYMGKGYIGKILDGDLVEALEAKGIDPCGEEGEFHTLVVECEIFKQPVAASIMGVKKHEQMWYGDLVLKP